MFKPKSTIDIRSSNKLLVIPADVPDFRWAFGFVKRVGSCWSLSDVRPREGELQILSRQQLNVSCPLAERSLANHTLPFWQCQLAALELSVIR